MLCLTGLKKLKRDKRKIYFGVFTTKEIKEWRLEVPEVLPLLSEGLSVSFSDISESENSIYKLKNPIFITPLPEYCDQDEYVVFFINQNEYLPFYLEQSLYKNPQFAEIIDTNYKSSKNSTKVLRRNSIKEIIIGVFDPKLSINKWPELAESLSQYVSSLIDKYPYLGYLPVKERIEYREKYLGDQVFAWEMYIKLFYDQWVSDTVQINIPALEKEVCHDHWSGNFFDRTNPFWIKYFEKNSKFRFSAVNKKEIYVFWRKSMDFQNG